MRQLLPLCETLDHIAADQTFGCEVANIVSCLTRCCPLYLLLCCRTYRGEGWQISCRLAGGDIDARRVGGSHTYAYEARRNGEVYTVPPEELVAENTGPSDSIDQVENAGVVRAVVLERNSGQRICGTSIIPWSVNRTS